MEVKNDSKRRDPGEKIESEWIVDLQDTAIFKNLEDSLPKAKTEFGIEVIWLTPEEQAKFNKAAEPVRKEFVTELESQGLPGQKLMDRFLELQEKYSDEKYKP